MILTAPSPVKYKSLDTRGSAESRSVVVHHLGFWSRGPWFESGRDYQNHSTIRGVYLSITPGSLLRSFVIFF